MRPEFGSRLAELVFAPNNPTTATLAARYCEEALLKWEPRIENVEAFAAPSVDHPNRLDIRIGYRVRATNQPGNLVYPFYLRAADDQ